MTSIFATDLLFEPTTYSPIVKGSASELLFVALISKRIFEVLESGDGETVAGSSKTEPVPSSLAIPSKSPCSVKVNTSASKNSKYALRNVSKFRFCTFNIFNY